MPLIQSPQNRNIKHLARLIAERKYRRAQHQAVLEGAHLLTAYLDAGNTPEHVFIPENRFKQPEIATLLAKLPENICTLVANNIIKKISSLNDADDIVSVFRQPENLRLPTHGDCII